LKKRKGKKVAVSCDGTWQRRGFASKNRVATLISVDGGNSKVLDVEVMSTYCNTCAKQEKVLSKEEFSKWKKSHKCSKNHEGSAGSMEVNGMLALFKHSRKEWGLDYTLHLGDGDSKAFAAVRDASAYKVEKLECCGHVQKRMGKRLMDKVSSNKSKTFSHNGKNYKGIGGAGRLNQKAIKRIQGHYGGAICGHAGDLAGMKKAVWAIWHHRGDRHDDCGDWCPAKSGKPVKNILPPFVLDAIKPVFEALSEDSLLKK
jgi:hypothetical protein